MITLKTLPQASKQEIFDQVANHLLTQNEKSNNRSACLYRTNPGSISLKCAIGCLISDEEYTLKMEGKPYTELVKLGLAPKTHVTFLSSLQTIHDKECVDEWPHYLVALAGEEKLKTTIIDNFKNN